LIVVKVAHVTERLAANHEFVADKKRDQRLAGLVTNVKVGIKLLGSDRRRLEGENGRLARPGGVFARETTRRFPFHQAHVQVLCLSRV
jgi:hypothetical protein